MESAFLLKERGIILSINNNINGINTSYNGVSASRAEGTSSTQKMASGQRINSAADDAAGLAVSENLRSVVGGISAASQNAQNGVSLIQTAEGGLNGSSEMLQRMKELATQAANGTYSDEDRALLNREFSQLKEGLNQISSSTNYNGKTLLDGSISGDNAISLQVGSQGGYDQQVKVGVNDMSAEGLGVKDLDIGSLNGASSALEAINGAIDSVSSSRGDLGAVQNRLESSISNLEYSGQNLAASESSIRDVDMAKESMKRTQSAIIQQASISIAAQGMNLLRQNATSILR